MATPDLVLQCESCGDEVTVDESNWQAQLEDIGWEWTKDEEEGTIIYLCSDCVDEQKTNEEEC